MIRFVGYASCGYDFSESVAELRGPCASPDGTPSFDAPSESSLLFHVLVHHGATPLSSLTAFLLAPNGLEEKESFERFRTCLAVERNRHEGRAYCASCGASTTATEPSCSRCGAQQFSFVSLAAKLDSLHLRTEREVKKLSAVQESVMATSSFNSAIERILTRPVDLMPAKASTLNYVLFRNRVWTTREFLSPEEWDALVRDRDDRKAARLKSVIERSSRISVPGECGRIDRPPVSSGPSYQTAPLTHYDASFRKQADAVFEEMRALFGRRAKRYKGSYSILAKTTAETVAKIIIYQRGLGRENGAWPVLEDGVYVLVRTNGEAEPLIWQAETLRSAGFGRPLDPDVTLGIAPRHERRFAYLRIADTEAH